MKIEITPEKAEKIECLFEDWAEIFATRRKGYKNAYLDGVQDLMDIFNLTLKDIKEIAK